MKKFDIIWAAVLGVCLWQLVVWVTGAPHFILPSPWRVVQMGYTSRALIAEHAWVTVLEVVLGLVIGSVLGIVSAIVLAASALCRRLFLPILVFSQAIPVFALAPILTLWFGYGIGSKIVMTVLIIYFPVTSAFHDGLARTPRGMLDLAEVMGARDWRVMWRIRVPAALPALGSGLKLAAVYAPIGAVIGEWVGASRGLGYLMLLANGRAKIDLMFACLIVLAIFAICLHALVGRFADYLDGYSKRG
ncbi:MAG: ABC transporter permease [Hyphomicrobiales bacterium]|nr:MAG: ABC transporter permease [Hyphomicrobiales bacterium]